MIDRGIKFIPWIVLFSFAVFLCFLNTTDWTIEEWAMWPGQTEGMAKMIIGYNFLHGDIGHLIGNLTVIAPLLFLLAIIHSRPVLVSIILMIGTGLLLWTIAEPWGKAHIGASGFLYALVAFVIVYGIKKRTALAMAASVLVLIMEGGSAIYNSLPATTPEGVSWQGHLSGLITGSAYALVDRSDLDGSSRR